MRFRRYPPRFREKSIALELEPRSGYRLQHEARWDWQHSVSPVPALRYIYQSGHRVYVHLPALKQLHDNVAAFIRSTENLK